MLLTGTYLLGSYVQMYEPASGAVKQPGAILQQAGAPGVFFQTPSSVAGPGHYVTMVTHSPR